ncbi:MAG TPA: DinB family protein [Gemmatimonadales bacterium]|nr:DinB family protein [Gemmatimonadales bacterium]
MSLVLSDLPALVLGPLEGRPDADWQRAPEGKWTPAQIVEHLALGLESSGARFKERRARPPMVRRPRTFAETLAKLFIFGLRRFPPGRRAPEGATPAPRVERAAAEGRFRIGLALWEEVARDVLPARPHDLFVKHPRLGDLTMDEWMRFHVIHARHHARQIVARLAG